MIGLSVFGRETLRKDREIGMCGEKALAAFMTDYRISWPRIVWLLTNQIAFFVVARDLRFNRTASDNGRDQSESFLASGVWGRDV